MCTQKKEIVVSFESLKDGGDDDLKAKKFCGLTASVYYFLKNGSQYFDIVLLTKNTVQSVQNWLKEHKMDKYVREIRKLN